MYYTPDCADIHAPSYLSLTFDERRSHWTKGMLNESFVSHGISPLITTDWKRVLYKIKYCLLLYLMLYVIYSTIPRNNTSVPRTLRNQPNRKIPESVSIKRPKLSVLHAIIYICMLKLFVFPLL